MGRREGSKDTEIFIRWGVCRDKYSGLPPLRSSFTKDTGEKAVDDICMHWYVGTVLLKTALGPCVPVALVKQAMPFAN